MATHYVYDDPDISQLAQGDVLRRTAALVELLDKYHPHYAKHPDYKFFVVLTQTCDLVRRHASLPKTPYISIAPARTLEETLLREAAKSQKELWQRQSKVIGEKEKNTLSMFLHRLLDNNESGYFYLHDDQGLGIHVPCCAVLSLSVSLRAEHYQLLLDAKIAQLKDTFQAKLGWLIGNMYSRVGTTEWDKEYPDNSVRVQSKKTLDETLHSVADEQIKEGVAELRRLGKYDSMSPSEIFEYIRQISILPRSKKFESRANEASKNIRLVNLIHGRTKDALHDGELLRKLIKQAVAETKITEEMQDSLAETIVGIIDQRLSDVMSDRTLPGRDEVVATFIRSLLNDSSLAAILR